MAGVVRKARHGQPPQQALWCEVERCKLREEGAAARHACMPESLQVAFTAQCDSLPPTHSRFRFFCFFFFLGAGASARARRSSSQSMVQRRSDCRWGCCVLVMRLMMVKE